MARRRDCEAYKGYLIRKYPFEEGYWIEKDQTVIQRMVPTMEAGRTLIDTLTAV
jgi:hypothetical protein